MYILLILSLFPAIFCERQEEILDSNGGYLLGWEVDLEQKEITFDLTVQTKGWVGFGLNKMGSMVGADIIIGGIGQNSQSYLLDYHGVGMTEPVLDMEQNYEFLESSENATHTHLKFKRQFDTCDPHDFPINEDTINVIWSFGESDAVQYHGPTSRGSKQFNFLDAPKPPLDLSQFSKWEIRINETMPQNRTTYQCTIHKSPRFEKIHNIIGFSAAYLPSPEALLHTHHFNVARCRVPYDKIPKEIFDHHLNDSWECSLDYHLKKYCQTFLYIWALGGKMMLFPENVGFPIGDQSEYEYFELQVHYDNPEMLNGVNFVTGLDIYYTDKLRENQAGVFKVGQKLLSETHIIPPKSQDFVVTGHCSSDCINENVPNEGINVFNVFLHSHLAGRKLKLRQFRNHKELPWISVDNNYDFNFQQNRALKNHIKVYPGDQITYECTCDTMSRNIITKAGLDTTDEMCIAYLYYYPKNDKNWNTCSSSNENLREFYENFGIEEINWDLETISKPSNNSGLAIVDYLNTQVDWTEELKTRIESINRFGEHKSFCVFDNYTTLASTSYPQIDQDYKPTNLCNREGFSNLGTDLKMTKIIFFTIYIFIQLIIF